MWIDVGQMCRTLCAIIRKFFYFLNGAGELLKVFYVRKVMNLRSGNDDSDNREVSEGVVLKAGK